MSTLRIRSLLGVALAATLTMVQTASAADDPREILRASQKAIQALKTIKYEIVTDADGPMTIRYPKVAGTVKVARDAGKGTPGFRADVEITPRTSNPPYRHEIASNGTTIAIANHREKTFSEFAAADAQRVLNSSWFSRVDALSDATPFEKELAATSLTYGGTETIDGEECHVVLADLGGAGSARWAISKKDNLPRRYDRIIPAPVGPTTVSVSLRKIEVDAPLAPALFAMTMPSDFADTGAARRASNERAAGSGSGGPQKAHDFTLKTADGKDVSLESLKGKVVLLDFWAVWCGPCKMAMPGIQRLHEKYKDKPVAIFGVNTWERPGNDPFEFMKKNNYTYGLLMKGDELAQKYGIRGIPAFVLIGPDGMVIKQFSGFSPSHEKDLADAIDKALAAKS